MRTLLLILAALAGSVLVAASPSRSLSAGLASATGPSAAPAMVGATRSWGAPGAVGATGWAAAPGAAGSYRAPVTGALRVLRGFSPPVVRYRAGHLGVDLADPAGTEVLAAGAGRIRFAGQVAGRSLVVIAHPDGISTEYEPVAAAVTVGEPVRSGQPIGRLTGRHRGCPAVGCLHWGARRGGNYLDPLSLLRPLGVVRLLPWDSSWPPG